MSMLEVKNLRVSFQSQRGAVVALKDISFSMNKGETIGIVGESGSGKSVTSLAIMGLMEKNALIESGSIEYNGENILSKTEEEMREIRGAKISMIFQEPMTSLNPSYMVGEQIDEILRIHKPNMSKEERFEKIIDTLEFVKIKEAASRYYEYPFKLSGGMRQRIMIAMSMVCEPDLLIADEPTTALDASVQDQVLRLMKEMQEKKGTSIIFITHDLGVVAKVTDKVVVMYRGDVVETGTNKDVLFDPQHPYTKALTNSIIIPGRTKRKTRLDTIKGDIDYSKFEKVMR